jgi:hypothetical protein
MTLQFIKTPYSWLVHITKICTSKYNAEQSKEKITIISLHFLYYKNFTQQYGYENHYKSLYFSVLLKVYQNYNIPSSIEMKSKQQDNIYGIYKIKFKVYYYKIHTFIFLLQNCVSNNEILFPKIPIFVQSQVTSSWFKTNKNLKFKLTMFHDQSLS